MEDIITVHSINEFYDAVRTKFDLNRPDVDYKVSYALFPMQPHGYAQYRLCLLVSMSGESVFGWSEKTVLSPVVHGGFYRGAISLYKRPGIGIDTIRSIYIQCRTADLLDAGTLGEFLKLSRKADSSGLLGAEDVKKYLPPELRPKRPRKPRKETPVELHEVYPGVDADRLRKIVRTLLDMMKAADDACEVEWSDETYRTQVNRLKKLGLNLTCQAGWKMDGKLVFKDKPGRD